jgi:hypothetical protein
MPAVNLVPDLGNTNVKLRFKERYVSEGLNMRQFGLAPRGIVRGFNIVPAVGNWVVDVDVDSDTLDSVAVIELSTGVQVKARLEAPISGVDLKAMAGLRAVLVLRVDYATGAATVFALDAYSEADYLAAADEFMCVIGEVDVPAAPNPVTGGMIMENYRKWYFMGAPKGTDDTVRGGTGRSHFAGISLGGGTTAQNVRCVSCVDAAGEEVLATVEAIPGGLPESASGKSLHFDFYLMAGVAEKYAAFYVPVLGKTPVTAGGRIVVDLAFELKAVSFKAGWGGTHRLGLRLLFLTETGTFVSEESIDFTDGLLPPFDTSAAFVRVSRGCLVPATACNVVAYIEAFGVKKAVGSVFGDSYLNVAFFDVYIPRGERSGGDAIGGGGVALNARALFLTPSEEVATLERIYDDLSIPIPYGAIANRVLCGAYIVADTVDDGSGQPITRLVIDSNIGGASMGGMVALDFRGDLSTRLGSSSGTAHVGTTGRHTARTVGGGQAAGYAGLENTGLGETKVTAVDGKLTVKTSGTGDMEITSGGSLELKGNIPGYPGGAFDGALIDKVVAPHAMMLREISTDLDACGLVYKRVEDILALFARPYDVAREVWIFYTFVLDPVSVNVDTWVPFPYVYVKGGDPRDPAKWHLPLASEIDTTAVYDTGGIVPGTSVEEISKFGFVFRIAYVNPSIGQQIRVKLTWRFVPTP